MATYFDDHGCEPLPDGMGPDHMLHMARYLLDSGHGEQMDMDLAMMFPRGKPPPASKEFVEKLERFTPSEDELTQQCPICIAYFAKEDQLIRLPCRHTFHVKCITPWLEKTNSCPVCRHELPTDDKDYEKFQGQKKRAKAREQDLAELHNSMYS